MLRKIIKINEELCNGCGLCVTACHESAIGLVDGKAKLLRDDYCDGLGNCLPVCPTNAINFEEREALEYNDEEVKHNMLHNNIHHHNISESNLQQQASEKLQIITQQVAYKPSVSGGCPGSRMMELSKQENKGSEKATPAEAASTTPSSMLRQWPVQIQLVPVNAPYFQNANLLIGADCTAYAFADFHRFMKNKITLIGCPKLDEVDYSEKLTQILSLNQIKSITVIRMEVPCCGGIVHAVKTALTNSGQMIPWSVITIGTDGTVLEDN